ncbi:MAG: hypothetical protein RLZZ630_1135 [Bacteroidota bacterium]|jgi:glycosyltransferase involved in cell wall biosynthesis
MMETATRRKVLITVSNIDFSLGFIWLVSGIDKSKFEIHFLLLGAVLPSMEFELRNAGARVHFLKYSGKSDLLAVSWKIFRLLLSLKPDVVHAHLLDACLMTLPTAWLSGISTRIHTRHHSSYHHVYHPRMVVIDRLLSFFSTKVVAISNNVLDILVKKEKVSERKVVLIHHGFDLGLFKKVDSDRSNLFKNKLGAEGRFPVVGVISRFTEWKGVHYVIPAFIRLLDLYPEALLVLANAKGDYEPEIRKLLDKLPVGSYREIKFEKDLVTLYSIFDIFVHVPVDSHSEAFGQTYVEALAAGTPSIFTLSGVAPEFVVDRFNALVVPFRDSDAIHQSMLELLHSNPLFETLRINGPKSVSGQFSLQRMIDQHSRLYEK